MIKNTHNNNKLKIKQVMIIKVNMLKYTYNGSISFLSLK